MRKLFFRLWELQTRKQRLRRIFLPRPSKRVHNKKEEEKEKRWNPFNFLTTPLLWQQN